MAAAEDSKKVDHYSAQYSNFGDDLLAQIREEAFGKDIGQTGWLTIEEQDMFIEWLALEDDHKLLDVACGSGRPTLRIASVTKCHVTGIDLHEDGVATAIQNASDLGLVEKSTFVQANANEPLPLDDETFDAAICIDAINHLPDRGNVLKELRRVLKPNGRLLITDPIVITGPMTNEEIATRASIGVFLFVPPGTDEAFLEECGFAIERVEDRTANMAANAKGWLEARATREAALRKLEGDAAFEGQQRFFTVAANLAEERRLSRFAFLAHRLN